MPVTLASCTSTGREVGRLLQVLSSESVPLLVVVTLPLFHSSKSALCSSVHWSQTALGGKRKGMIEIIILPLSATSTFDVKDEGST